MTTLTLNENLLTVLAALKAKQKLAIIESDINGFSSDWREVLKDYFFKQLSDKLIEEVGLSKNQFCLMAVEHLEIPEEWMTTYSTELDQFSFSY
ncbi:hypothetical protein [Vibrio metschnikovii]|uniref:Uncharacterized protein n=1 Tax=Vibrio metschnikovii TaxID=28172 RepID=A0A9X0RB77_VIBME|nr:hypothetical protein [Vibrio metschnikovii]MBC5852128.1 hypothetical protein [Vibrio metschnikovii]